MKARSIRFRLRYCLHVWLLLLLTAHAASAAPHGPTPLSTAMPDIIGGREADEQSNLWQAALVYSSLPRVDGLFCGATFIDAKWLLTAAHCFHDPKTCERALEPKHFYVAHGSATLDNSIKLETAAEILFAPGWDCKTLRNDLALVKLSKPVGTRIVTLADASLSAPYFKTGTQTWITGWGVTEKGARSARLMEARIEITDKARCQSAYKERDLEKAFCAGESKSDACTGDSGGPLYVRTGTTTIQLGVVSFGFGCARKGFPGVYTRIADHLAWIRKSSTTSPSAICSEADIKANRC